MISPQLSEKASCNIRRFSDIFSTAEPSRRYLYLVAQRNTLLSGRLNISQPGCQSRETLPRWSCALYTVYNSLRLATIAVETPFSALSSERHVGTLQPLVTRHAGEPASPHKVISYYRSLYVLWVLRGALQLRRLAGRAHRTLQRRWIVQSTQGTTEARAEAGSQGRIEFRHGG